MNYLRKPFARDMIIGALAVAVAIAIPFLDPGRYILLQITLFFIWAMVVTQWNLVFGVAGIFSLAQMTVFAVAAYAVAMLGLYLHINLWIATPIAALVAVAFSALVGVATLRLKGPYVALLTLAVNLVIYELIVTDADCFYYKGDTCYTFTGGTRAIGEFGDFGFRNMFGYKYELVAGYYLCLVLLVLGALFAFVIIRSPLGFAFRALRDNEAYAISRGMNRIKYQIVVFTLAAFFTGLAGAMYAGTFKVVGPNILDLSLLLYLVAMMVVGGLGSAWGPLLGCALLMASTESLTEYPEWREVGLGAMIVLFIVFLPQGLVGGIELALQKLRFHR